MSTVRNENETIFDVDVIHRYVMGVIHDLSVAHIIDIIHEVIFIVINIIINDLE